ncbi:MAG: hypothetical protein HZA31_10300, partial [Opitutae bacterium]|nr:hypothetical protein [Opitutae bacterium]
NPTAEERSTAAPLPVSTAGFGDPALQFSPWLLRGLALGVLAFALQLFVDFHFKIPALAMAFAVVSATLVSAYWPAPVPSGTGVPPVSGKAARLACGAAALAVLAFTGLWAVPLYRAEALRTAGRDAIDRLARRESTPAERRATLARAEAALERAVVLHPRHAQAWADLSYVRSLRMHEEPAQTVALGRAAETAARRALALTSVLPEAWVRLGVALDMQDRWGDAGEAFVRAFALAPRAVNPRFYYAYHLAQRPFTRAMARAEVETCLRLDPGHRAAQLLRQQLATGQGSF